MKKIKIGKKEYSLCENIFDINDERFNMFKQYFLQVIEKLDKPLFIETFAKYVKYHDAGQHSDGLIEWYNFKKAIDLKQLDYDAYSFCFCLICLNQNEDQRNLSEDYQLEKLKELRENGLSRGLVEEAVENFMKASPKTFGAYLQVLEMMKAPIPEEALSEL